ncbi:putative oxidoreductase YdhV [subsurface metagenome]
MSIPKGYAGNTLIVDLGKQKADILPTDKFLADYGIKPRLWLGGDGFITKILWEDFPRAIDPLSAENEIIITMGPWTATAAPWAGRAMLGCISPETGGFGSGSFGWFFPCTLKYAGFDIIIIRGKAEKPVYIFIDDQNILFKDASHLWGEKTSDTVRIIRNEIGERYESEIRVLSTSIAGEHLVRYAPPCADSTSSPGRSGAGAVMGSKNLKAIAVRGTGEISLYDPRGLLESSYRTGINFVQEEPMIKLWQKKGGTTALLTLYGRSPNGEEVFDNVRNADFPHLMNVGCLNCPSPCYHWLQIKDGKYSGLRTTGGHITYFTSLVDNLGIADLNAVTYYDRLTQELGIDPSSFALAFTWAADCLEQGLLQPSEVDNVNLRLGDQELVWDTLHRVAYREGKLGNLLADGVAESSKRIGGKAESIAPHVKGKPYLPKDPKLQAMIWAFGFLTNPRGGDALRCHNVWELAFLPESRDTFPQFTGKTCAEIYTEALQRLDMPEGLKKEIFGDPPKVDADWVKGTKGKALFSVWTENFVSLFNSLVTCMYSAGTQYLLSGIGATTYAEILSKITGWDVSYDELMKVGERVFNLQRLLNYRLNGWDYRNDRWADKRQYEPAARGIYKGKEVPWDATLQEYYAIRGWSTEGIPTRAKISELKLDDVVGGIKLPD